MFVSIISALLLLTGIILVARHIQTALWDFAVYFLLVKALAFGGAFPALVAQFFVLRSCQAGQWRDKRKAYGYPDPARPPPVWLNLTWFSKKSARGVAEDESPMLEMVGV